MNLKKSWIKKQIPVQKLSLWDENARFPDEYFRKSELTLIEHFLNKKDFKIKEFAKEIVSEFDLPQLEKIVVLELGHKNIVLEGNRRLVVYKLLINPLLVPNESLRKFFIGLKYYVKIDQSFKLEANVTSIKEDGLRFVDRKHNKGNNEINWGEAERRNFAIRRSRGKDKDVLRVELANAVKKLDLPKTIKESVLGRGYVTTFYRIVDSDAARRKLGYFISKDRKIQFKNKKIFQDLLKIIVFNILRKKDFNGKEINSRSLNKSNSIDNYVNSLKIKNAANVDREIEKGVSTDLFGGETLDLGKIDIYKGKAPRLFDTLIDPDLHPPKIGSEKIKDIFIELQKVSISEAPTATAMLLRILFELTIKEFAQLHPKVRVDKNGSIRTIGGKEKATLKEKIDYISSEFADSETQETVSVFNGNSVFTENLNKIAHSRFIFASSDKVSGLWKDAKRFWEFLILEIIKLEKRKK